MPRYLSRLPGWGVLLALLFSLSACTLQPPEPATNIASGNATATVPVAAAVTAQAGSTLPTPTAVKLGPPPTATGLPATAQPAPSVAPATATPVSIAAQFTPTSEINALPVTQTYTSPSSYGLVPPQGWEINEQKFNTIWYKPNSNKRIFIQVVKTEHIDQPAQQFMSETLATGQQRGDISGLQTSSSETMLGGVEATRMESHFMRKSDNAKIAQIEVGANRDNTIYIVRLGAPEDQIASATGALDTVLQSFAFGPPVTTNMFVFIRDGAVWLYRSDSLRLWQLTTASPPVRLAGWSNTGDQIFYVREPGKELVVMNADGGNEHVVFKATSLPDAGEDVNILNVQWSPLGDRIMLLIHNLVPTWIYTVKEDGSDPARIGFAFEAVWAPQGKQIAYRNFRSDVGPVNIFVADQDGKNVRNLTEQQPAFATGLAWGSTGIAFLNRAVPYEPKFGRDALELINPDGSGRQVLLELKGNNLPATSQFESLVWLTPKTLSFASDLADKATGTIQVVDTGLPTVQARPVITMAGYPDWSQDRQRVVFVRPGTESHIFVANALDGSGLRQLTYQGNDTRPVWSPQQQQAAGQPENPGPEPAIVVQEPLPAATVHNPLHVSGTAIAYEGTVQIRLRDSVGTVIAKTTATASAGAPVRGTFSSDLRFTPPATTQAGTLEVYEVDALDGNERNLVSIPVTLAGR